MSEYTRQEAERLLMSAWGNVPAPGVYTTQAVIVPETYDIVADALTRAYADGRAAGLRDGRCNFCTNYNRERSGCRDGWHPSNCNQWGRRHPIAEGDIVEALASPADAAPRPEGA